MTKPIDQTEDEPSPTPGAPATIGGYQVRGRLGEGGMGEVFECYDPRLMRVVAVKRVLATRATSAKARARFWREARALAAIDHPGVVKVFEIGETPDGSLFLAMQRVLGQSLEHQLGDGPWPWTAAVGLGARLAEILAAVHAAGVIHRDLKPSNVLVQADGMPVLVDFGIAAGADPDAGPLTDVGQVVGTISYMAPEQLQGLPNVGPPADIFAWGILVYRLLSGRHPFARDTREQMAMALASGSYPPLGTLSADTPAPLVALIERCLAVDPAKRPQNGAELAAALAAIGHGVSASFAKLPVGAATISPTGPTEQPSVMPLPRAKRSYLGIVLALLLVAGIAVTIVLTRPGDALTPTPDATTPTELVGPGPELRPLPPRPVVILTNSTNDNDKIAAIVVDVLHVDLDARPLDVIVAPEGASKDADLRAVASIVEGAVTLTVTDARDGKVRWSGRAALGRPALAIARELGAGFEKTLGIATPSTLPPLTSDDEVYRLTLAARAAGRRGDQSETRALLTAAFRRDPHFVPARMEELALLRTERRLDDLTAAATTLLERTDLSEHDRTMASAWLAVAKNDAPAAVKAMYDVIDRWPYDLLAYESLLALLFLDTRVADLGEAERIAHQALTFAPSTPTVLSRYIRALGYRGRGDEIEPELVKLGVPLDALPEVRTEMSLYQTGANEDAIAGFDAWLAREPDHVYALNMGIVARIVAGRCSEAAEKALERISRVERRGTNDNLSWSYSLAVQALACMRSWDAARNMVPRWTARHAEAAGETIWTTEWIDLAAGKPEPEIVASISAKLDKELSQSHPLPLEGCELLALLSTAPDQMNACAQAATEHGFDLEVAAHDRTRWNRLAKRISARKAWLAGDTENALAMMRAAVFPKSELKAESDLVQRIDAMFMLARCASGDEATATWAAIEQAGFERIYRTPVWTIAHARAHTRPDPR